MKFTSKFIHLQTKTTKLFECDDGVVEDSHLDKQMNAGCLTCPTAMSRLDVISVCKEVPESCASRQLTRSSGKTPTNPARSIKSHTLADFDHLVGRL